jgi:hypothetical protein
LFESILKDRPGADALRFNLAVAYYNLGNLYIEKKFEEPLPCLERSRDLSVEVNRKFPSTTAYQAQLASTLGQIAILRRFRHETLEARACFLQIREIQEKLIQDNPSVLRYHEDMVETLTFLALCEKDMKQVEPLVGWSRSMLVLARDLARQYPQDGRLRQNLARNCSALGQACNELNSPEMAKVTLAWAEDQLRDLLARPGESVNQRSLLISTLAALAENCTLMKVPVDQSRSIAQELCALQAHTADDFYRAARGMAWCACCESSPEPGRSAQKESRRDRFCDQAMRMLAESARRGFKDNFKDNRRLTKDTAFVLLRSREDFRRLVDDLVFPSDPFAR